MHTNNTNIETKYFMKVSHLDTRHGNQYSEWDEEIDNANNLLDAKEQAEKIVKSFNDNLRPFEYPRNLVSVKKIQTITEELYLGK